MSETINITIVLEIGNRGENRAGSRREIIIKHDTNMTLMSTLLKENLVSGAFCGGLGSCKRCRICFLSGAPAPGAMDRSAFSADELREGYRLACMSRPKSDCAIYPEFIFAPLLAAGALTSAESGDKERQIEILTTAQSGISDSDKRRGNNSNYNEDRNCMIAVDLGTTTIAMQLMEMSSGRVIDTYCAMNPQRSYGADVLSRIQAAASGHAQNLRDSVWKTLNSGVEHFCKSQDKDICKDIRCMCIAGNTTMEHLLMGLSTEGLGRSPFTPVEIGLQKCKFAYGENSGTEEARGSAGYDNEENKFQVYITPGISAFVGGDVAAGLYHCGLLNQMQSAQTQSRHDAVLFIDLGTNGEMAITDGSRMIVTATAAGPAFEGGANAKAPGSDMIAITASLLEQDIIDETGLMREEYFEKGIDVPIRSINSSEEICIHITQKDIRDIQMAKAAVRAGIEILYEKIGRLKLAHVYLAGGFGYYLDIDAAAAVGLLPEHVRHITEAAGNTSLAGAFDMGRDLWTGRLNEEEINKTLECIESINLAKEEEFESLYLDFLNFPAKK